METVQFKMNLPLDIKQWIEHEARVSNRSQTGMVITLLRLSMPLDWDASELEQEK